MGRILHGLGCQRSIVGRIASTSRTPSLRSSRVNRNVALKVSTSDAGLSPNELRTLQAVSRHLHLLDSNKPSSLLELLDHFVIEGPNGQHQCLVTELLGPSVSDVLETTRNGRLPIMWIKSITKQLFTGLEGLHAMQIGHGGDTSAAYASLTRGDSFYYRFTHKEHCAQRCCERKDVHRWS